MAPDNLDALEWLRKHLEVEGKHDGARALGLRIAAETSTRESGILTLRSSGATTDAR